MYIYQPEAIYEIGDRPQNEDAIFPVLSTATSQSRVFIVCDGVGGFNRGEVASYLTARTMGNYFEKYFNPQFDVVENIIAALQRAEYTLQDYKEKNPEAAEMATTLALLYITEQEIYIAYCGDSRIYQFRNGKVYWKTQDHNLANELLAAGFITEEEAAVHPEGRIISRVVRGIHQPAEPDVFCTDDILPNDIFLLCTDGVLEQHIDEELEILMQTGATLSDKKQALLQSCQSKATNDNFSAYLIQIERLD